MTFVPFTCAWCDRHLARREDIHEPCWRFIPPMPDSPEVIAAMAEAKRILAGIK